MRDRITCATRIRNLPDESARRAELREAHDLIGIDGEVDRNLRQRICGRDTGHLEGPQIGDECRERDGKLLRFAGASRMIGMTVSDERGQMRCAERALREAGCLGQCSVERLSQGAHQCERSDRIGVEGSETRFVGDAGCAPQFAEARRCGGRALAGFKSDRAHIEHDALERGAKGFAIGREPDAACPGNEELEGGRASFQIFEDRGIRDSCIGLGMDLADVPGRRNRGSAGPALVGRSPWLLAVQPTRHLGTAVKRRDPQAVGRSGDKAALKIRALEGLLHQRQPLRPLGDGKPFHQGQFGHLSAILCRAQCLP